MIRETKAVSPVIGTILMVAVTVVMAAIIGGFVYQMGRPQQVPNLATSLTDDPRVALPTALGTGRIGKLTVESGDVVEKAEIAVMVTYWNKPGVGEAQEITAMLDGSKLVAGTVRGDGENFDQTDGDLISVVWVDADASQAISPGDRMDFYEAGTLDSQRISANTDFSVKVLHKASKSTISSHTIKPN